MKKYFIVFAAALLSFAACNKEIVEPIIENGFDGVLTFVAERPQLDVVDTKTAWDSKTSSIVWSNGDKIRVGYTLDGNWMGQTEAGDAKFYASEEVAIDGSNASVGTFNVPISTSAFADPKTKGKYIFYSIYPSSLLSSTTVSDPTKATVTLKASQSPAEDSFEGATDIMVGKTDEMDLEGLPADPIELSWNRVVAHAALTFSNMAFDGTETLNKITLTFNEDAKVAGSFTVNISDGTIGTGSANEIVLEGNGLVVDGSSITTWATVLPVKFSSLDVEIKTDKAIYTRSITGLSKTFKKNARNTLTINMSTADREAQAEYDWVKKDITEITSSDVFVIVGNNGNNYAMSNGNSTSSAPTAVAVTVADDKLSTAPAESIQWTLSVSDGSYTFYPNGTTETWLYCTNSNNGVRVGTNTNKVFTLDETGYLKNTATSRYVGVYNSSDWRCYALGDNNSFPSNIAKQTFAFYVKSDPDTRSEAELSFATTSFEANIGDDFTAPTLTNPHNLTVTYSSSDENLAVVDENTGEVVLGDDEGTVTITATFAGDEDYKPGTASYTITISDPNATGNDGSLAHPYTASEAAALALNGDTGPYYISGIVTKIQNQYSASYGTANFWIDENGSATDVFEGYKIKYFGNVDWVNGNAEIAVNDEVIINGTLTVYNTVAETNSGYLVSLNGKTKGLTPGTLTVTPDNDNKQITVTWGAATGTESTISYLVTCGTQTYNATAAGSHTFTMADYGTYNISVVASADDAVSGTASTTATISGGNSVTVEYIFNTDDGLTALGITKPDASAGTELGTISYTVGAITMAATSGNTATRVWNSSGTTDLRIYRDGTFTFTTSTGNIKSIVLAGSAASVFTADTGTFSSGTWIGSAESVKLTATGTGKINTITVTYE